jgi:hypothetical protein
MNECQNDFHVDLNMLPGIIVLYFCAFVIMVKYIFLKYFLFETILK